MRTNLKYRSLTIRYLYLLTTTIIIGSQSPDLALCVLAWSQIGEIVIRVTQVRTIALAPDSWAWRAWAGHYYQVAWWPWYLLVHNKDNDPIPINSPGDNPDQQ